MRGGGYPYNEVTIEEGSICSCMGGGGRARTLNRQTDTIMKINFASSFAFARSEHSLRLPTLLCVSVDLHSVVLLNQITVYLSQHVGRPMLR